MPNYRVTLERTHTAYVDVEADDEDQAVEIAFVDAPDLCAYCSGSGNGGFSVDEGEWDDRGVEEVE